MIGIMLAEGRRDEMKMIFAFRRSILFIALATGMVCPPPIFATDSGAVATSLSPKPASGSVV